MQRRVAAIATAAVLLWIVACAGSAPAPVTDAEREAFCEVMRRPPLLEGFRDPSDDAARERFLDHVAAAAAVAPPDIEAEATKYHRAIEKWLTSRADGAVDRQAEQEQLAAGQAVNDYVDGHCF